jgi:hypothetical protein
MNTEISNAAAALGRKGGAAKSEAKTTTARTNGAKGGRPTVSAYMSQVWDGEEWRNTSKIAMTRAVATNEARVMRKFGDKARVIKLELGE